jgi:hypothetical protein
MTLKWLAQRLKVARGGRHWRRVADPARWATSQTSCMKTTVLILLIAIGIALLGCAGREHSTQTVTPASQPGVHPPVFTYPPNQPFVVVVGEVNRPGRITWINGLTLTAAIDLAGGFTDFAAKSEVTLRKTDGSAAGCSFVPDAPAWTNSPTLHAGDTVQVPRRGFSRLWR